MAARTVGVRDLFGTTRHDTGVKFADDRADDNNWLRF